MEIYGIIVNIKLSLLYFANLYHSIVDPLHDIRQ